MGEKVKLPKAVCEALDAVQKLSTSTTIVFTVMKKQYPELGITAILNQQSPDRIMEALVLGYEPELTPEEQLKFVLTKVHDKNIDYKSGAWYALKVHGIQYDWLEDYAE